MIIVQHLSVLALAIKLVKFDLEHSTRFDLVLDACNFGLDQLVVLICILGDFLDHLLGVERLFNARVHLLEVVAEAATEEQIFLVRDHDLAVAVEQQVQLVALVAHAVDPLAFLHVGPASRCYDLMHRIFVKLLGFEEFYLFNIELQFV